MRDFVTIVQGEKDQEIVCVIRSKYTLTCLMIVDLLDNWIQFSFKMGFTNASSHNFIISYLFEFQGWLLSPIRNLVWIKMLQ